MGLATTLGFFPTTASFTFARGSDGLMELISINVWVQASLVFVFGTVAIAYKNRYKKKAYIILSLLFLVWFMSGRTISIFPDGRLSTGWFYWETSRINICQNEIDCEKVFYYETKVETLPLWRIRIKNKQTDKIIFIGPLLWEKAIKLFQNNFSKYSKSK